MARASTTPARPRILIDALFSSSAQAIQLDTWSGAAPRPENAWRGSLQ